MKALGIILVTPFAFVLVVGTGLRIYEEWKVKPGSTIAATVILAMMIGGLVLLTRTEP